MNIVKKITSPIDNSDDQKLYQGVKTARLILLGLWATQLLMGLVSMIKDHKKNSALTYVSALGTAISFFLYICCMYTESILRERDMQKIDKIDELENKVNKLLDIKTEDIAVLEKK